MTKDLDGSKTEYTSSKRPLDAQLVDIEVTLARTETTTQRGLGPGWNIITRWDISAKTPRGSLPVPTWLWGQNSTPRPILAWIRAREYHLDRLLLEDDRLDDAQDLCPYLKFVSKKAMAFKTTTIFKFNDEVRMALAESSGFIQPLMDTSGPRCPQASGCLPPESTPKGRTDTVFFKWTNNQKDCAGCNYAHVCMVCDSPDHGLQFHHHAQGKKAAQWPLCLSGGGDRIPAISASADSLAIMNNSPAGDREVSCAVMNAPSSPNISRPPAASLLPAGSYYGIWSWASHFLPTNE